MQVDVTDADRAAACDFADWHEGARQFTQEDVYQLARCIATHREAARIEGIRLGLEAAAGQKRYQFICWIADRFIEKHVTPLAEADALFMAAAAFEASEEDVKFGDPDYGWTEDDAHAIADEEIIAGWESA